MRTLVIILIALITFKSEAQTIIPLTFHGKIHGIHQVPFNKVVVFDNRMDTTKIKIFENGKYPIKVLNFDKPAPLAIKDYIENSIKGLPQKEKTIYINLQELKFSNVNPKLFFSAEAYLKKNNRYWKVASVRRGFAYSIFGNGQRYSAYKIAIGNCINYLINDISRNYYEQKDGNDSLYTLTDINNSITNEWISYNVNNQRTDVDGVYETFDKFKNNIIEPIGLSVNREGDSLYQINFLGKNTYYSQESGDLNKAFAVYSQETDNLNNVFAVSYHGTLFIAIKGTCLIPLIRKNNTFYFYVPNQLPNMYSIISSKNLRTIGDNGVQAGENGWAGLAIDGIGLMIKLIVNTSVISKAERIYNNGVGNDMRNCFIDMDSGDIVY